MNAPVAHPQVTAFVAAVRANLDDLSRDEVDELTDGLEADLADAVADSGATPADLFGDPAAYAAELRSAAGLPPRAAPGGERHGAGPQFRQTVRTALDGVRAQPWWPAVRDFVVTLRPVWWVLRASIAALGLAVLFGTGSFLLFLVFAVVSVELGRRRLAHRNAGWRTAIAMGNGLAVFGLLVAGLALSGPSLFVPWESGSTDPVYSGPAYGENGIWVDGTEVRNIFPYDNQGRPLTDVQLYDENGRPIAAGDSARQPLQDEQGRDHYQVPAVDNSGQQRWNVYPLRQRVDADLGSGTPSPGVPQAATPPTVAPGALIVPSPAPSSPPSASPTGAASASPSSTLSPSATSTPSPTASRAG
jgi:hypothetical protein